MQELQEFLIKTELVPEKSVALTHARDIETMISVNTEGKHETAHSPVEVIIGSLGSCLTINVQRFAKMMNLSLGKIEVSLKGYRDRSIPQLVKIEYILSVESDADEETLDKMKEFIENKSTTYNTLKNSVEISGIVRPYAIEE